MPPGMLHWLPLWGILFGIIYFYKKEQATWRRRRNIAIGAVLVPMNILLPLHIRGTYNLVGLENGGIYVTGMNPWVVSFQLPPNATYKSDTLSNRYALETAYVGITTFDDFVFYILDENIPDIQYEPSQGSLSPWYIPYLTLAPYMIFPIRLSYYYSSLFLVANWTFNIHNPSLNMTADLTLVIHGTVKPHITWEWAWRYFPLQNPTWALLSLCVAYVASTLLAYDDYRKRCK